MCVRRAAGLFEPLCQPEIREHNVDELSNRRRRRRLSRLAAAALFGLGHYYSRALAAGSALFLGGVAPGDGMIQLWSLPESVGVWPVGAVLRVKQAGRVSKLVRHPRDPVAIAALSGLAVVKTADMTGCACTMHLQTLTRRQHKDKRSLIMQNSCRHSRSRTAARMQTTARRPATRTHQSKQCRLSAGWRSSRRVQPTPARSEINRPLHRHILRH